MQDKYYADEYGIVDAVQIGFAELVTPTEPGARWFDGSPFKLQGGSFPAWLRNAIDRDEVVPNRHAFDELSWDVNTPHGIVNASRPDWIVRSKHGVLDVYKDAAFHLRFKLAIL